MEKERVYVNSGSSLSNYLTKMKGGTGSAPSYTIKDTLISGFGGLIAISVISCLTLLSGFPCLIPSLWGSCVLAFCIYKSPFAQPRSIIGGHVVSTTAGLVILRLLGNGWWSIALAICLAIWGMMMLGTVHPPAGANPIIVITTGANWYFLLYPVLIGSIALVLIALTYNNLFKDRQYPQYWW